MVNEIKIVSFDPSLSNLGIARLSYNIETEALSVDNLKLVETKPGTVKTVRKNSDDMERCKLLHKAMVEACRGAAFAIAEVPVGSQSARAMCGYGACVMLLASCPIPLIQVTPTEAKLAGAGISTATKQEMIKWATQKYPDANWPTHKRKDKVLISDKSEHLADAIAAAEAGVRTEQFRQALALCRSALSVQLI